MSLNESTDIQELRTNVLRRVNQRRFVDEEDDRELLGVSSLEYDYNVIYDVRNDT